MKPASWVYVFLTIALVPAVSVFGTILSTEQPYEDYGHLGNTTIGGHGACVATSMINSFVFLQNRYPDIFDHKLIPDTDNDGQVDPEEMTSARLELHNRIWFYGDASTRADTWEQKVKWFEDHDALVDFRGMIEDDITGWYKPIGLTGNTYPTLDFLYHELDADQDIEIFVYKDGWNHALTLSSITYDTATYQGTIDYIDSNHPEAKHYATVVRDGLGRLVLTSEDENNSCYIYGAFAECPEPTMFLLAIFGAAMCMKRRR